MLNRAPRANARLFRILAAAGVSAIALAGAAPALAQDAQPATPSTATPNNADSAVPPATTSGTASNPSGTAGADAGTATVQSDSASSVAGGAGSSPGSDQTPPDVGRDEIVVTGIRQSLASAQAIKRNADTVVDAITAEDIGALPDRSVNEALQRVPGVAITRFAAPNDSQHFSVQGSGVVLRGLSYVRGEFNGRDTFAANAGREIGFNDIPTEVVGSVEVFKGLTPDLIEGGISGTVNINTRKPFDTKKTLVYLSGSMSYGDLVERGAPSVVGLFSKQWESAGGSRFGLLASGTFTQQYNRADSVFLSSFLPRFNAPNDGVDGYAPDGTNFQGSQYDGNLCDGNNPNEGRIINAGQPYATRVCDSFVTPNGQSTVYTPLGGGFRSQDFSRKRNGIVTAAQFETSDRSVLVTAQYQRISSTESWIEHTSEPSIYYPDIGNTFPAGTVAGDGFGSPTSFTFDEDGVFTSGTLSERNTTQQHNVPASQACTIPNNGNPYTSTYCPYPQFVPAGLGVRFANRYFYTKSTTQDAALNIKITPTDRLGINLDGQYVKSNARNIDDNVSLNTYANASIDLTGKYPQVGFLTPGFNVADYFANNNTNTIYYNDASNNRAINDGDEYAFRADANYQVSDDAFLRGIRVGGRYAKRQQTVRTNDYNNWGSLSATWTDQGPSFVSGNYADNPVNQGAAQVYSYDNFFRGKSAAPPSSPFIRNDILRNHDSLMTLLRDVKDTSVPGRFSYTPIEDRTGNLIRGYFLPSEIYENSEETYAGYARADFGYEFANSMKLSGNVGVRYVHTTDKSAGALTFPQRTQLVPAEFANFGDYCAAQVARASQNPSQATPGNTNLPVLCRPGVSAAQQASALAFATGTSTPQVASQSFDDWLPSLNMRLDLTNKLLFRFAASKAISRPAFGDLRNFLTIGFNGSTGAFEARSSNPNLRPIEAKQADFTAEWYFAKVGSLTAALFYKQLDGVILGNSGFTRSVANGGSTFDLQLTGPANSPGKTKIKGAELSYQQTYDFLPGMLSGIGFQGTYTFIKPGTVQVAPPDFRAPTDPTPFEGDGYQPPLDITGLYNNLPLPGLSKHNFNASLFYDLHNFYARVAYSWRSKYLLTNRDCCFPFLPVYSLASGQLDGSAFYTVNEHLKLGVEAQNLLDTTTKTSFLLSGTGQESPRSYFKADRTFTVSARMTF